MTEPILFVDDEENVLNAIKRQLRKKFKLKTALGGAEALALIKEEGPFSVVVSDMRMPKMNGIQLLSEIKKTGPRDR